MLEDGRSGEEIAQLMAASIRSIGGYEVTELLHGLQADTYVLYMLPAS